MDPTTNKREPEREFPLPIAVSVAGETVNWHVRITKAPQEYDGFGTHAIYEYNAGIDHKVDSFRIVLIRDEHLAWQVGRYNSGFHAVDRPYEWQYAEVVELLRKRMMGIPFRVSIHDDEIPTNEG